MSVFFDIAIVLLLVLLIYLALIYIYEHRFITSDQRIAIDYLPIPVYFGLENRLPLVINDQMYELIYDLKGKPLTDVAKDFDILYKHRLLDEEVNELLTQKYNNSFFIKNKEHIYCVEEKLFADGESKIIQINAQDITLEYNNLCRLKELNMEMKQQNERLQSYIQDSIAINREKELLDAKINIHGKFGDNIALTRHLLKEPENAELARKVQGLWRQIVVGLSSSLNGDNISHKGYEEIKRVSDLVNCKIDVVGKLPDGDARPVMLKFLREALNNAIRHADATNLYVNASDYITKGIITVSDNGTPKKEYTKMGGGLSSLKEILEKSGVILTIDNKKHFTLILQFPETLRN